MRPLYLLLIAIFTMSIGFGLMTPAVSLYTVLGFGVNEWELGFLGAIVSLPYIIGSTIFGRYSDRIGRKPLVLGGVIIYAGVALAYVIAPNFAFLVVLRLLEGLGFSLIWPAGEAWVGDLSIGGNRSLFISNYSVAWSAGYMLGPFLLGIIVTYTAIQYSFILAGCLVLSSLPILIIAKSFKAKKGDGRIGGPRAGRLLIIAVLMAMVIWGFAQLAYFFLIPAYALDVGMPAAFAGYLIGTVALFRTIIFVTYPRIEERLKKSILPLGMLLIAASMFITWVATGTIGFFLAGSVLGLAFGIIYAYSLCHVLERPAKGLYAGLFESSIGIGQIAGPLSMGYIAFVISPAAPYFAMGILGLASALAIALAMVKGSKEEL
jgi:hypothetical protein